MPLAIAVYPGNPQVSHWQLHQCLWQLQHILEISGYLLMNICMEQWYVRIETYDETYRNMNACNVIELDWSTCIGGTWSIWSTGAE